MDPAVLGTKLASSLVAPLVKRLFVRDAAGAGLVERPVRVSALVSFRGEKRTLAEPDVHKIAGVLVRTALRSPGERPFPADEETAVTDALARTLLALGDLDMDDVQAVRLGHGELARELLRRAPTEELTADAEHFLRSATEWACVHVIDFFTRRSSFVARTLVEQVRGQAELISRVDELIARTPRRDGRDSAFERRYLAYIAKKHSKLFIYGIDLINSPGRWPLDAAYLSLQATAPSGLAEEIVYFDTARRNAERTLIAAENALRQAVTAGLSQTARERVQQAKATLEHAVYRTASLAALHQTSRIPLPADEALADHERIMLRGEAGSGKTTLIQWLAVSAARPTGDSGRMTYLRDRIPFVLPLRSLTRHGGRLPAPQHFLDAVGAAIAGEQPAGWEARVLSAGRGLVLVDGIDEVPEAERALARAWLVDLVDAYPGNRWLVTSRPSAVREDWLADESFTELVLSPMRPEDVVSFVRRWHTAARPATPGDDSDLDRYQAQLIHAVRAKPDLGRLATNPLMCGLICALHRDRRGFLPLGRKELYEAALTMLLARRDRERGMPSPELREEPQLQILQRLAYWLIKDGRTEMARERAVAEIDKALPALPEAAALGDADTVLAHLLNRSGLLRAPSTDTIDFCHRTFQDFLGARALLDEGTFGMVHKHAADDQWEDVIRMAVAQGRPRDRGQILGELLRADSPRALLLAASCLEQATELDPSVRTAIENGVAGLVPPPDLESAYELAAVGPLILDFLPTPQQLTSSGAETRAGDGAAEAAHLCVITASLIGTDTAIPYLAEFADHPSWRVRKQLSGSWHRFDTEVYGREVVARLRHDDLYLVAHSAAELAAVRAMGGRRWMQLEGDFAPEDLTAHLAPDQLTRLDLRGTVRDLSVLARFPRLETLYITECPPEVFLAGLAELPLLTQAGLSAQHAAVSAQAGLVLPQVTTLHVYDLGTERQLRSLPAAFPALRVLRLLLRPGYDPRKDSGLLTELFPGVSVRVAEAARRGNHE